MTWTAAQSNHRSWADFYLDVVATDGNAQMLSRMAVALVFPMFMGAVCIIRSVILFQRGRKHDKEVCLVISSSNCQPIDEVAVPDGACGEEVYPMIPLAELQSFNSMVDRRMAASPVDGLIVYPEGMMACMHNCMLVLHGRAALLQHASPLLPCWQGIGAPDEPHCQ